MENEIIIDPPAPTTAQAVKKGVGLVLKSTSSKDRARHIGQPVGPKSFVRTKNIHDHLGKAMAENKKLNNQSALPCETIIVDMGVKLTDASQIVNIDDVKTWDLVSNKQTGYLGSHKLEVGDIEHDPLKSNLLLRGHDSDRVISESTTYINTSVKSDTIVSIANRDSMPRAIAPVYENESDSYILSVLKKKLGSKFRKNCLYVVKTNVFRVSDAVSAQRLYEYIESLSDQGGISKSALTEATLVRKRVHELICKYKGVNPSDAKHLSLDSPYTDANLGIMHVIYCISLTDIPGYNHDDGSLFITNLDISVNIGLHQPPPLHPTRHTYNNNLIFNPGYVNKCIPQIFKGYAYYVKDLQNQKCVYTIVNNEVVSIDPQQYPNAVDASNELEFDEFIRVFSHDKQILDECEPDSKLIIPITQDFELSQAMKSGLVYESYELAKAHLDKFSTSLSVDMSKARAELASQENKCRELTMANEIASQRHQTLLKEIQATQDQLDIKQRMLLLEHDSKVVQEQKKAETLGVQAENDLRLHEQRMQAAQYSARTDESTGMFKILAAVLGTAAAGIGLAKAYGK